MALFQHGVGSGDPLQDRVILWTRVTSPEPQEFQLKWEVAEDRDFQRVVSSGATLARVADDQTARVDAAGLSPGRQYFYRFHAGEETSITGRTKTLPAAEAERKLLLNLFRKHLGSTVVLSGDIHIGMVCELEENPFEGKRM